MKTNTILIRGLAVTALCILALTASAQQVDKLKYPPLTQPAVPNVERITLDNGLRLYILEDHALPTFRASVVINGGSYLEPDGKIGLAEMVGAVLRTGGTEKWTGDQIDEALEAVGGTVETSFGLLTGSAFISTLNEHSDLALEVLSEILRRPVFDTGKINLAKVQMRSAISRRNDDPFAIAQREFAKQVYGPKSVYARQEEYTTVNSVKRDDLMAFQRAVIVPKNIQLAIWGDFKRDEMLDKVKKYFGDWTTVGPDLPKPPAVEYNWRTKVYYIPKEDVNQSNILIGHIGGLTTDADHHSRIVMNDVLGAGFGSRLFSAVRSREGLAYSVAGYLTANFSHPGTFFAFASTKSESTTKAIREMIKEIRGMQTNPPTAAELKNAKDGYDNSFVFNFDTRAKVINRMMTYDFYGVPQDFLQQQRLAVAKVTSDDVVAASRRNLHPDSLIILVVGKGADFGEGLEAMNLGPIDTLDIKIPSGEEKKEVVINDETRKRGGELFAKAVKAHGGGAAIKKVTGYYQKGNWVLSTPQGDFPIPVESWSVFPDKQKEVATFMGRTVFSIRNGAAGWKSQPDGSTAEKSAEDIADDDAELGRDLVAMLKNGGTDSYQIVFDKTGKVGDKDAEFVVVLDKTGKELCRLGIDAAAGQILTRTYWGETPFGEGVIEDTYSDWKPMSGVFLPMAKTSTLNGNKYAVTNLTDVVVNPKVDDSLFAKP